MTSLDARRAFWLAVVAAIATTAAVGVVVVVDGPLGDTDIRLIATLVAVFLCAAAALAAVELIGRSQMVAVAWLVLLAAPLALVAFLVPIWTFEGEGDHGAIDWVPTAFVWVVAAIFTTTLRLLITSRRLVRTMVPLVGGFAAGHAAAATALVWSHEEQERLARAVAALAILMVATWILTPILQRLTSTAERVPAGQEL